VKDTEITIAGDEGLITDVQDFASLLASDYSVAISGWLQKGWDLFKKDAGPSIVFTVIAVIAYAAAGFFIPFGIGSMVISVPLFAGFIIRLHFIIFFFDFFKEAQLIDT
jgi:hypothetical protein